MSEVERMRRMRIRVRHSSDWGCEHTTADVEAYEKAVLARIHESYPGADVEVEQHQGATEVRVYDCLETEEESVSDACREIVRAVWDDATFWPPSEG